MNGAGKNVSLERVHNLEEQAVFALTQLMTLYLDKGSFEKQRMGEAGPSTEVFHKGREIRVMAAANDIPPTTLGVLEHPVPGALRNGMRAIGTALYEETNSTEAMSDVLYRVMEKFPSRDQDVIRILDHAFSGIGGWWS
jgi:hypothetical protein